MTLAAGGAITGRCLEMASLRDKQIASLKRMLNLNAPQNKSSLNEPTWKVLVYDRFGQDIISPLLSVRELRDMGVTLHLLLHSDRGSLPDVPAVYFVMPSEENVTRICQDFQNQLYETYYFNFISAVSRQRLEDLASTALQFNVVSQVSKMFDQYLNFISLEDSMFTVRHQNRNAISYYAMNKADVKDVEIEAIMDTIVDSLFSVFVTFGTVPIIRSPRGNAAEMVAEKLDKKLRENLRDARNSLFTTDSMQSGQLSFQRPLLVVLDRNMDLATPLHHTWTYQALAHDVLDFQLNRVVFEEKASDDHLQAGARPKAKVRSYDLGPSDKFWMSQKGNPFPEVAEAVQSELESYRSSEEEVKRLKSAMGLEGEGEGVVPAMSDATAKLTSAMSSLPELLEKKRLIDSHTNLATSLLDKIKARKLDVYFEVEERLMTKTSLDKPLMDIITDVDAGTAEDKMRMFIIFYILGQQQVTDAEFDQYLLALEAAGCDLSPINYIKRWRAYSKMAVMPNPYGGGGTKRISMFSKLMSTGSQFVMEGVKNFVVKKHNLPITRIVDALMEMKSDQETDEYRYFDPKMLRVLDSSSIPRNKNPYQEVVVFVVGGGNYIEYQNLMDYLKTKSSAGGMSKKICYGCSEIFNADQFLSQICQLGQEI